MFDFGGRPLGALLFFVVNLSDRRVPTLNGPFTYIVSHLFETREAQVPIGSSGLASSKKIQWMRCGEGS